MNKEFRKQWVFLNQNKADRPPLIAGHALNVTQYKIHPDVYCELHAIWTRHRDLYCRQLCGFGFLELSTIDNSIRFGMVNTNTHRLGLGMVNGQTESNFEGILRGRRKPNSRFINRMYSWGILNPQWGFHLFLLFLIFFHLHLILGLRHLEDDTKSCCRQNPMDHRSFQ